MNNGYIAFVLYKLKTMLPAVVSRLSNTSSCKALYCYHHTNRSFVSVKPYSVFILSNSYLEIFNAVPCLTPFGKLILSEISVQFTRSFELTAPYFRVVYLSK